MNPPNHQTDAFYLEPSIALDSFIARTQGSSMNEAIERAHALWSLKEEAGPSKILDLGCGVGRDAVEWARRGYKVVACDYSEVLLKEGRALEEKRRKEGLVCSPVEWTCMNMHEAWPVAWMGEFDAVWAMASLVHCTPQEMDGVLQHLKQVMKNENSELYMTVKKSDIRESKPYVDEAGRFFTLWTPHDMMKQLQKAGWNVVTCEIDHEASRGVQWITLRARCSPEHIHTFKDHGARSSRRKVSL